MKLKIKSTLSFLINIPTPLLPWLFLSRNVFTVDKDQHPQSVLKQKPPSIQKRCNKNKAINIVSLNVRTLRVKEEFTKVIRAQEQERRTRRTIF